MKHSKLLVGKGNYMEVDNKIASLVKEIPLKARLEVSNRIAFMRLLTELGFRENKFWKNNEDEILRKLFLSAKRHTWYQLNQIEEWERDGKPG